MFPSNKPKKKNLLNSYYLLLLQCIGAAKGVSQKVHFYAVFPRIHNYGQRLHQR